MNKYAGYKFIIVIALLWSSLILLSLYLSISNYEEHSIRLATSQASDFWNKDSAFRKWATRHGGLYVKPDERTPPNPLLAHLPHRDVETTDGVKLTLMNPAYMMRQMTEEFEELYGVQGSITGQVLLDPEGRRNKPDDWELESLKKFDQGATEITAVTQINGASYLRLMRPMIMNEGCVPCHGHLGFKVGDIRGGVSVSVPLAPFEAANTSSRNQAFISHFVIWLLGVMAIFYIETIKQAQIKKDLWTREIASRAQKMNALGNLSSGIAHDYNNMLGVIMGYSELLENALSEQPKLAGYAHEVFHAGKRGARLTKKLLAFSRKKSTNTEKFNLNTLLQDEQHMLEKTLTARIKLVLDLAEDLWPVNLDSSDMEDAIINLSINAMHAIDGHGQLTLRTSNEPLNAIDAQQFGLKLGDYILLGISDTGCGMDKNTRERVFEPFFSTKGEKGTGLGLAQVYGFIERSNGAIRVYSELGHGTQFVIYLPRYHDSGEDDRPEEHNDAIDVSGNETILVVDDEPTLLNVTYEILNQQGYRVIKAISGKQALEYLATESIDLVISDVIMPEMDGYQLAKTIQEKYPEIKIQLASGFADTRNVGLIDETLHQNLLNKPFNSQTLLQGIRALLGNRKGQDGQLPPDDKPIKLFEWTEQLSVGIPQIDQDHKVLVSLINRCITTINNTGQQQSISTILDELVDYTRYHFAREERIMEVCEYPNRIKHQQVHQLLIDEVGKRIQELGLGELTAKSLLEFLSDWLSNHIKNMDKAMMPYFEGKESDILRVLKDSKSNDSA